MDDPRLLHLSPKDNVCAATAALSTGDDVTFGDVTFSVTSDVLVGHKIAVRAIAKGDKVIKYGASIGSATQPISAGDLVHTHNLASDYLPSAGRVTEGA